MARLLLILSMSVALAACAGSTPQPSPIVPTPFPEIATTPELQAWTTSRILDFRDIRNDDSFIGFGLEILPPAAAVQAAEAKTAVLVVTSLEPPEGWFATPLHLEPIALVLNSETEVHDLSSDDVARILTGRTANWRDLEGPDLPIVPVVPLEDADTRSYLERVLLEGRRITPTAMLGPSPEIVLQLVNEHAGAIGIVPLSAAGDASLLSIDGIGPDQVGYPWVVELLGIAPSEPSGIVREWLAWVQATDLEDE